VSTRREDRRIELRVEGERGYGGVKWQEKGGKREDESDRRRKGVE